MPPPAHCKFSRTNLLVMHEAGITDAGYNIALCLAIVFICR